jgi:hypothetical protein
MGGFVFFPILAIPAMSRDLGRSPRLNPFVPVLCLYQFVLQAACFIAPKALQFV